MEKHNEATFTVGQQASIRAFLIQWGKSLTIGELSRDDVITRACNSCGSSSVLEKSVFHQEFLLVGLMYYVRCPDCDKKHHDLVVTFKRSPMPSLETLTRMTYSSSGIEPHFISDPAH